MSSPGAAPMREAQKRIVDTVTGMIDDTGVAIMSAPAQPVDGAMLLATLGLAKKGHPELLAYSRPGDVERVTQALLVLARRLLAKGERCGEMRLEVAPRGQWYGCYVAMSHVPDTELAALTRAVYRHYDWRRPSWLLLLHTGGERRLSSDSTMWKLQTDALASHYLH
mgnify:CR=1 FL=1|jgi:hypothetical protein